MYPGLRENESSKNNYLQTSSAVLNLISFIIGRPGKTHGAITSLGYELRSQGPPTLGADTLDKVKSEINLNFFGSPKPWQFQQQKKSFHFFLLFLIFDLSLFLFLFLDIEPFLLVVACKSKGSLLSLSETPSAISPQIWFKARRSISSSVS